MEVLLGNDIQTSVYHESNLVKMIFRRIKRCGMRCLYRSLSIQKHILCVNVSRLHCVQACRGFVIVGEKLRV